MPHHPMSITARREGEPAYAAATAPTSESNALCGDLSRAVRTWHTIGCQSVPSHSISMGASVLAGAATLVNHNAEFTTSNEKGSILNVYPATVSKLRCSPGHGMNRQVTHCSSESGHPMSGQRGVPLGVLHYLCNRSSRSSYVLCPA